MTSLVVSVDALRARAFRALNAGVNAVKTRGWGGGAAVVFARGVGEVAFGRACGGGPAESAVAVAGARYAIASDYLQHIVRFTTFVDRALGVVARGIDSKAKALEGTGRAVARRASVVVASSACAIEARVLLIVLCVVIVMRLLRRCFSASESASREKRDVRVVLVTGGGGGLGTLLLEGIRDAFPNAIVYGTSRKGADAKKFIRQQSGFFGLGTPSKEDIAKQNDPSVPIGAEQGEKEHPLLTMDVTDDDSVRECIQSIAKRHGKIDVLINNAGVCLASWAKQTPRADADMIMQTNFLGPVSVIRHALPYLSENANVINIGSIAGRIGIPFQSMYSASKAALMVYTDALRMETKSSGIRVSLVEPGDLQPGMASVFKSNDFETDPVAVRAEKIMREEEAAGTKPTKVVAAVVQAIKSHAPRNRYLVGPDSWLVETLSRVCSYSVKEYFLASHYRIPPRDKAWIRV